MLTTSSAEEGQFKPLGAIVSSRPHTQEDKIKCGFWIPIVLQAVACKGNSEAVRSWNRAVMGWLMQRVGDLRNAVWEGWWSDNV